LALGNAGEVHFRKYGHRNYDHVMMQRKFLISEIPRILNINAQCTGFLSSLTGERDGHKIALCNNETEQI
jgi:hypothetical protein